MKKDVLINLRINKELKEEFQQVTERYGYTMSQVLTAFMKDVVKRDIVPMNIRNKIETKREGVLSIPFIKKCLEETIEKLDQQNIVSVSLFGSYSKGEATSKSDIDFFIEAEGDYSLFDLADLQIGLEVKTSKKVDLVTKKDNEYFIKHISKEKIVLYERIS